MSRRRWLVRGLLLFVLAFANLNDIRSGELPPGGEAPGLWSPDVLPNALFGFFKTDYSFHGVEEIKDERIERNVLLYNIYVKKVVTAAKPAAATSRWSWPFKGA